MTMKITELLEARSRAYAAARETLEQEGATEVDTPILCSYPDLAPMRQLVARHPTSGRAFCLRIAPEEHLARLVAKGATAVFEIATNFRDERVDHSHLIEFCSVEALFAGRTVSDMRRVAEGLCRAVAEALAILGGSQGGTRWLGGSDPFPVVDLVEWLKQTHGVEPDDLFDEANVRSLYMRLGYSPVPEGERPMSEMIDGVIEAIASSFNGPVFISTLPAYLGGPAHPFQDDPRFLDRSELFVSGLEIGSVATQLADGARLRERYQENHQLKERLKISPNEISEDLLSDLDRLPPYGGLGVGLDRLIQLSLGLDDIRETRTFIYE